MKFLKLDGLLANLTGYVEARISLVKIEVKEDIARTAAKAAVFGILGLAVALFVFFLSMAVAYKIGEHLGVYAGFGIVSLFYIITALVIWFSRDALSRKLEDQLIENIKHKKK
ncbi:MAG TPA: phage holin family protein [Ohtaekwangia sp.]|nr:phage holin family protein [Ohtaekwangia sp.]